MSDIQQAGTFELAGKTVYRMGYGAMQLAGPGVFGPPADEQAAITVLQRAIEMGINHIDTSDFYGPYVTNQIIKKALHPYRDDLLLVTKIGARRDDQGNWLPAFSEKELTDAVHSNLINLGVEQLDVVNLRAMFDTHGVAEGSLAAPFEVLAKLQQQGLIRHLGVSNVTPTQIKEAQQIAPVVCVQNHYNLVNREDGDLVDKLAEQGIAYVPYFPLGGFSPLQSDILAEVAETLSATSHQVALAWLLQRSPNMLLIPGTSKVAHLESNIAAAGLTLPEDALQKLNGISEK